MEKLNTYLTQLIMNDKIYAGVNIEARTEDEAEMLLYINGYENHTIIGELLETINENID